MPQRMVNKDSNSDNYVDNPRIIPLRSACDTYSDPTHSFTTGFQKVVMKVKEWFWPFRNPTAARHAIWRNTGSVKKSLAECLQFYTEVVDKPNFDAVHLATAVAEETCARNAILSLESLAANR